MRSILPHPVSMSDTLEELSSNEHGSIVSPRCFPASRVYRHVATRFQVFFPGALPVESSAVVLLIPNRCTDSAATKTDITLSDRRMTTATRILALRADWTTQYATQRQKENRVHYSGAKNHRRTTNK